MDQRRRRVVAAVAVGILYKQAEDEAARWRQRIRKRKARIRKRKARMLLKRQRKTAMLAYLSTVVSESNIPYQWWGITWESNSLCTTCYSLENITLYFKRITANHKKKRDNTTMYLAISFHS